MLCKKVGRKRMRAGLRYIVCDLAVRFSGRGGFLARRHIVDERKQAREGTRGDVGVAGRAVERDRRDLERCPARELTDQTLGFR